MDTTPTPDEIPEGTPELVDDRNPRYRRALEELDATVATLAADMLTGGTDV
jgi:hypothetical protein